MGKTKQFKHTSRFYKLLNNAKIVKPTRIVSKLYTGTFQVKRKESLEGQREGIVDEDGIKLCNSTKDQELDLQRFYGEQTDHANTASANLVAFHDEFELLEEECNTYDEQILSQQLLVFSEELRSWSFMYKISHCALDRLLTLLTNAGIAKLPKDCRSLLKTPKNVNIITMGNGQYWYYGLENCIKNIFPNLSESVEVDLTFNIDGLPIFNSSKQEFWPILVMISSRHTSEKFSPQVVAIYHGAGKPILEKFLTPFVNDRKNVLNTGVRIGKYKITLSIKCFICDTPARCYVKGISYFNSYHGCSKCLVIGEYDRHDRHMYFESTDMPLRTDDSFRKKTDSDHHKVVSPLENLEIDLIADFPIADSLHLLHLGVMKRCLLAWMSGSFNYKTKWSAHNIYCISNLLKNCNQSIPVEIHRAVRGLDCIKFWKGLEFRTFLLYLGPVILKDYLPSEEYEHFLCLFCAVTLCSCKVYLKVTKIANTLFTNYIHNFAKIYGKENIASNIHNLCHIVNDVYRFGELARISSYPFENKLQEIKKLLRTGKSPLAQVAKRLLEMSACNITTNVKETTEYPHTKHIIFSDQNSTKCCFKTLYLKDGLLLANDVKNRWFLTKQKKQIVQMLYCTTADNTNLCICGRAFAKQASFFQRPFDSSHLNIYMVAGDCEVLLEKTYTLGDIKCKLIALQYQKNHVFFPLLHTLELCNSN